MTTVTDVLDALQESLKNRNRAVDEQAAVDYWVVELQQVAKWLERITANDDDTN